MRQGDRQKDIQEERQTDKNDGKEPRRERGREKKESFVLSFESFAFCHRNNWLFSTLLSQVWRDGVGENDKDGKRESRKQ